jgi:glycosyltransferase involved in cell wall biosynthesis
MTQKTPAVSVIMSVWNGLPYVAETIDSIVNQTLGDWEFIINDNDSTDGTGYYLMERARSEPRIRVILSPENLGCAGGFNRALAEAKAPWVAIIDADDRALPQRLERQLEFVARHPGIKVASTLAYYIGSDGRRVAKTHHDLTTPAAFERYMSENEAIGILNPGALIDRETMVALGGYRQAFFPAEDIDLWARISERGMILVQPEYLMEYRVHAGSSVVQAFVTARMKYEWSRACSAARRSGLPEPTEAAFLASWRGRPWLTRLNAWRKLTAKGMYRQAAFDWISRKRVVALGRAAFGVVLQPDYVLPRLWQQALPVRSAAH